MVALCLLAAGGPGIAQGGQASGAAGSVIVGSRAIPVTIRTDMGRRSVVEAACVIPAPQDAVWRVLTDYDHLADIVPFLTESRVTGETGGAKVLQQAGRGRLWIFHRSFAVTFGVEEQPESFIAFRALAGDFRTFDGFWRVEPTAEGTRVRHQVVIEPKFYLPRWAMRVVARYLMRASLEGVIRRCLVVE